MRNACNMLNAKCQMHGDAKYHMQNATYKMLHTKCHIQMLHAKCYIQNATCKMLHAICYMQNATCYMLQHLGSSYFCVLSLPPKLQSPAMPRTGLKVCVMVVVVGCVKTHFSDQLFSSHLNFQ